MGNLALPTILRVMTPETKKIFEEGSNLNGSYLRWFDNFLDQSQQYISVAGDKRLGYGGDYNDALYLGNLSDKRSMKLSDRPHKTLFADIVIPKNYEYIIELNKLGWTMVEVYHNSNERFKGLINKGHLQGVEVRVSNEGNIHLSQGIGRLDQEVYKNWPSRDKNSRTMRYTEYLGDGVAVERA